MPRATSRDRRIRASVATRVILSAVPCRAVRYCLIQESLWSALTVTPSVSRVSMG